MYTLVPFKTSHLHNPQCNFDIAGGSLPDYMQLPMETQEALTSKHTLMC